MMLCMCLFIVFDQIFTLTFNWPVYLFTLLYSPIYFNVFKQLFVCIYQTTHFKSYQFIELVIHLVSHQFCLSISVYWKSVFVAVNVQASLLSVVESAVLLQPMQRKARTPSWSGSCCSSLQPPLAWVHGRYNLILNEGCIPFALIRQWN